MSDLFIYLLKVSAGLAIISLPYYFLFREDPNLALKRLYLLLGIIASWTFPLITFQRPDLFVNLTPIVFIDLDEAESLPVTLSDVGAKTGITINWIQVLIFTYVTGLAFMFLKNLFIVTKWNLTWRKSKDNNGIAFTGSDEVFTLFSRIFVPRSLKNNQDLDNILLHEKAHIQQLHFIDLMVMEFALLLTWFNPFSWLISRMIKENHEHLADRQVLTTGVNPARYRAQLLNHTLGVNVFRLGNQFNHSLTLKRFNMMKKPKKSPMGILKIALLIPAILITLGLTTGMTPPQKGVKGKVVFAEDGEPAPGASVVIKNTSVGTVVDIDGTFSLNVNGDPEIAISFVGYATLIVKASDIGKKPLELEAQTFKMDLETVPLTVIQEGKDGITIKATDDSGSGKQPIFVLDGKVVKEINHLDPDNIESIDVIKDPNSELVKKYNAPDGVIIITSKDGASKEKQLKEVEEPQVGEEVFFIVEDMPMFPGGKAELKTYIYANLEYPESAKKKGISGEVMVQFNVKYSGELEDIEVASSSQKEFEKPAMDVFKSMPNWSPGKQRGKPVKVKVIVPVRFNADTE
jgi:TonB family protein